MSKELIIRDILSGDVDKLAQIYGQAVAEGTASFETEPPSADEMIRRFEELTEAGYPYIGAEVEGVLAGYAYAGPYRARLAYRNTVEDAIYIDPAFQGRGVGKALLGRLVELCVEAGFRQMVAVVGDSRNSGSINLHRSAGFQFVGTLHSVGYKHGRWLDTVFMQRKLGAGDDEKPIRA